MKKVILGILSFAMVMGLSVSSYIAQPTYADDDKNEGSAESTEAPGTSISLSPVSNVLQLSSNSKYNETFEVRNDGDTKIEIEVYAAPYSYVYSEDEDVYKLGFNTENNFTQITRWISFKDSGGSWVNKPTFGIAPGETLTVPYRIQTPDNIPAGGQYAVIFAHTLTGTTSVNGIKTEASPGLVIYGRSTEGEAVISAEISDMKVDKGIIDNNGSVVRDNFYASAKVKNTGNVDFSAVGNLKVDAIIGGGGYETSGNRARISVIPETELVVSDEWEDSPGFGLYKLTWTVTAGEETQTIEKIIFVNPLPFIIITIIVLTALTIWIIIMVRKRKERRSRLAV